MLATDFAFIALPRDAAAVYAALPKRKNGLPDRRFIVSRAWKRYENRQNERALDVYVAGGNPSELVAEPWGSSDAAD